MAAKSILWVLVFEGETFDIHLLPSGEAFASLVSEPDINRILEEHLPPGLLTPSGKFIEGKFPMSIPSRLAEKIRKVSKIKNGPENEAARGPVDGALMSLFVTQVVPRLRRVD